MYLRGIHYYLSRRQPTSGRQICGNVLRVQGDRGVSMDLYVWHHNGTEQYCETLFRNLVSDGAVENKDICVILKRYAKRDFYNLKFPNPPDDTTRWEYVSH